MGKVRAGAIRECDPALFRADDEGSDSHA